MAGDAFRGKAGGGSEETGTRRVSMDCSGVCNKAVYSKPDFFLFFILLACFPIYSHFRFLLVLFSV